LQFGSEPRTVEAQVQGAAMGACRCAEFGHYAQEQRRRAEAISAITVARISDIPAFDVHIVPSAEPPTGMGEPGLPPLAPAFANAIAQLTGKPLRQLPFNIESKS
jgi:isoquinoline 1-oxidoreductase beta subunit